MLDLHTPSQSSRPLHDVLIPPSAWKGGGFKSNKVGCLCRRRKERFFPVEAHTTVCSCVANGVFVGGGWRVICAPWFDRNSLYSTIRQLCSKPALLNCGTIVIWTRTFFVVKGCPFHCRMVRSISGFYSLYASSSQPPPQAVTTKNVYRHCQMSPWGQKSSQLRATVLNQQHDFEKQSCINKHCLDGGF